MKKILAILLLMALVISAVACGNVSDGDTSSTADTKQSTTNTSKDIDEDVFMSGESNSAIYKYSTFEEYCASNRVTDVVVATLIGRETFGNEHIKYTFEVKEAILGNASGKIDVILTNRTGQVSFERTGVLNFNVAKMRYAVGAEYLLPLKRTVDIYSTPSEYYTVGFAMSILLDDLQNSEMYNSPFALHVTGIDIGACTREEFIEYVRELTKDNETNDKQLSDAQTLEEIIADADVVYHIKAWALSDEVEGDLKHTEFWDCEILEALKGEIPPKPEDPEDPGLVWVIFFAGTVEEGAEYIVALEDVDGDHIMYKLITKDCIYSVSEKSQIKSYID